MRGFLISVLGQVLAAARAKPARTRRSGFCAALTARMALRARQGQGGGPNEVAAWHASPSGTLTPACVVDGLPKRDAAICADLQ